LRGATFLVIAIAAVFIYGTLGFYFLDREFRQPIPLTAALRDTFRLLFIVPASAAEPKTGHGAWFVDSVRAGFLSMMVLGVWQLLRPVIYRARTGRAERERVRGLLHATATPPLRSSPFARQGILLSRRQRRAGVQSRRQHAVVMATIGAEGEFPELVTFFRSLRIERLGLRLPGRARHLELYGEHGLKA
jgi:hypothetical protein